MLVQYSYETSVGLACIDIDQAKTFDEIVLQIPLVIMDLQRQSISKIIILDKEVQCLSMFELYRISELFIKALNEEQLDNPMIAVIKLNGVQEDISLFLETVCQNRGLQLKFCITKEVAKDWLGIDMEY